MNGRSGLESGQKAAAGDRGTILAFIFMVLFAGGNAVAVRFSNGGLPPFLGAATRFGLAAVIFWIIVAVRRIALPRGRALLGVVLYGLSAMGAASALLYWGLLRVPASLAAGLLALVPLITLILAWVHRLERLGARAVAGALIAVVGVSVSVMGGSVGQLHLPSLVALLGGTVFLSEGAVIFKIFPRSHPAATNAVAMTTGTIPLIILSRLAGEAWTLPTTASSWAGLAYLVVIGSVVVFYLYTIVLSRWTATAASYSFLLIPVVTTVLAALIAGDVITIWFVIGGVVALVGVWLGAIKRSPRVAELQCTPTPSRAVC